MIETAALVLEAPLPSNRRAATLFEVASLHPDDDALFTHDLAGCIPMPGALILKALAEMRSAEVAQNLPYIGFHQGPIHVAPSSTLDYHTPVLKPLCYRKIGMMKPGDTAISTGGDIVPVLGVFKNTTPAFGSFAPVRLRAPYFVLQSDLVMAGAQRLIFGGSNAEYTFGCDEVLIPA